jgi:hypothetical protein
MNIAGYFNEQGTERKKILESIHKIILDTNKKVEPRLGNMMGKEMVFYEIDGAFIYALSSVKTHMSLHNMIIYGHKPVHEKYAKLLNKATFQKGCINFKTTEQMPLEIVKDLMADCAKASPKYLEIYKARMAKKGGKKS